MLKKLFSTCLLLSVLIFSCKKNEDNEPNNSYTPNCTGAAKSFSADVSPLMESSCAVNSSCHGTGSTSGPGPLTTYTQIFNARTAIRSAVAAGIMPKNATFSSSQKDIIVCWIDAGAQDN